MAGIRDIESLEDLFAWLLSYFRSCPDFLKPCIFYLSIFPLNHTIRRRRLMRRWIAEGYARDNKECTAKENAEKSFSKLVNLSMILVPEAKPFDGRIPLCQVNGFLREYIISKSMEENLVFALEDHSRKNLQRTGRHLAIYKSWDRDENVFGSIDFSHIRSLTVFGDWKSFLISKKMSLLRVLDLEDVSSGLTNDDVKKMVKLLPLLKFLSLRRCRAITHLPYSLGNLRHLQTLDVRETLVIKVPKSIIKLEKLEYIRAGTSLTLYDDSGMVQGLPPPLTAAESPLVQDSIHIERSLPSEEAESPSLSGDDNGIIKRLSSLSGDHNNMVERLPSSSRAAESPSLLSGDNGIVETLPSFPPSVAENPSLSSGDNGIVERPPSFSPSVAENPSLSAKGRSGDTLAPNWLPKLCKQCRLDEGSHNGVEVPRGIGKLSNLHTLGVVNISPAGKDGILEELRNLTQLHKLGVSGINRNNRRKFFDAISDLAQTDWLDCVPKETKRTYGALSCTGSKVICSYGKRY